MYELYEEELTISPSRTDAEGRLGYPDAFSLCMDIAAAHAEALGVGLYDLGKRDLFWLTVKTQLTFYERPRMMERIRIRTWPEPPGKMRGDRSYQLLRGDQVLIAGKTEWAVIGRHSGQLAPMKEVYPAGLEFESSSAGVAYARIPDDFVAPPYASYRVRSTDIDVGGHMNNTVYVRALLGSLNLQELADLRIGRMDVVYRSPCYEGELLEFQRRDGEAGTDFRASKDGVTALLVRVAAK